MKTTPPESDLYTIASLVLDAGDLIELVYSSKNHQTGLALKQGSKASSVQSISRSAGGKYCPHPPTNNLISHGAILFAEYPAQYGTPDSLTAEIEAYLFRYVDLSPRFQKIAAYYALLTWVYDAFQELPYLRFRGDFGSGKTRALKVLGSICNKPFFASGASTVSPLFHVLDAFRGTLLFDEADFRFSDEKAELIKIFNNGNAKGFPVLRSSASATKNFEPRAFHVFGPKIVSMRRSFDDHALESRFLTEEMGQRPLRKGIPLNLPDSQAEEALALRNKLLQYRFDHFHSTRLNETFADPTLSPRVNQILLPLLSLIPDAAVRKDIQESIRTTEGKLYATRAASHEGLVLEKLARLMAGGSKPHVPVSDIAAALAKSHGSDFERPITSRFVGGILRDRLHLSTYKSHGVFVLPKSEAPKVFELCRRFGVSVDGVSAAA